MVNKKRLIKLTQKLISINSENPPGNESRIARFVQSYLKDLGLYARVYEFKKRRSNVVASLAGKDNTHSLLITPHLDTVPAGLSWKRSPFAGKIEGGRIYGLGATDCKGNLACALESIRSLVEDGAALDYKLIFAATADEESSSEHGLVPLLKRGILKADAALILDSDDFKIIVTQKGLLHLKVKIKGRRAHGAYPWRGVNAIEVAVDIIRAVRTHKFHYTKNKFLKPPTVNVGTIKGGDKVNIVADWCEFELDVRFLPGMRAEDLLRAIKKIMSRYSKKGKIEIESIQAPYGISERHPLIKSLKQAIRKTRMRPIIEGSEGATVITFFQEKDIPAVASGFGSGGTAHAADEYVKIDNLYKGARVLEQFLKDYKFG
jgi:succinyl-diaminopimelate desuccinylase